jgi:hypothetical protein
VTSSGVPFLELIQPENARRRCLGGNWIGQKKDKSGKRKAADKDRPVPHVEAKNSIRHCGDQL